MLGISMGLVDHRRDAGLTTVARNLYDQDTGPQTADL
jgi:hypothetical protein